MLFLRSCIATTKLKEILLYLPKKRMPSLRQFLLGKKYKRIKLKVTATNHLEVKATINGVEGNFILDTGASNSCVGNEEAEHFDLFSEDSDVRAAGAGATNMLTRVSTDNVMELGAWKKKKIKLVLFDLKHINQALVDREADVVHGIIGADILDKGKAVIDYSRKCLYLK